MAATYVRRAKNSKQPDVVDQNLIKAIEQLISAVQDLEAKVARLRR